MSYASERQTLTRGKRGAKPMAARDTAELEALEAAQAASLRRRRREVEKLWGWFAAKYGCLDENGELIWDSRTSKAMAMFGLQELLYQTFTGHFPAAVELLRHFAGTPDAAFAEKARRMDREEVETQMKRIVASHFSDESTGGILSVLLNPPPPALVEVFEEIDA